MKRLALATVLFAACASPSDPLPVPTEPPTRIDLRAATNLGDLLPVGITVDPAGRRFLFDERLGIFGLGDDGRVTPITSMAALTEIKSPTVELPYTDLVALAPDVFALTAIGDGFLLDTAAGTLTQHFCYVPDGTPAWLWQRTDALAYDAVSDRIWAQPQTYDTEGVLQGTALASYDRASGGLWDWLPLDEPLFAGAMVVLPGQRLVVAEGAQLKEFVRGEPITPILDLASSGITQISGLALDGDRLLVLDAPSDSLYVLDSSEL